MPRSRTKINASVFKKISQNEVQCLVCPGKPSLQSRHAEQHSESQKHKRFLKAHKTAPADPAPVEIMDGTSISLDDDVPISFADLWQPTDRATTLEPQDLYQDWLESLETEVSNLGVSLSPGVDEMPYNGQDAFDPEPNADYGVDLSDILSVNQWLEAQDCAVQPNSPTYPWPSLSMFATHLLFSSPRLRFTEAQKRAVLGWAEALKAPHVPTLYGLKKCQADIHRLVGNPTEKATALSGNIFYVNNVGHAIAKDYANPLARFAMKDYAVDNGPEMSQVNHGAKMLLNLPADATSPTVRVNGKIFFVGELLQCSSGSYFIPERYFQRSEKHGEGTEELLYSLGRDVLLSDAGFVVQDELVVAAVSLFNRTYVDIVDCGDLMCGFVDGSKSYAANMPHKYRATAGNRMVYSVPLIVFMDDVSGNISKQWNKHHVIYMSNANLPREMLEKEFFLRFVTSSPHATPMELMRAMRQMLDKAKESGIVAWDCKFDEEVLLLPYALFFAGDNPMHAEECSHGGLGCNFFCRTCWVGGTKRYKASDEGFESMFNSAELRKQDETYQTTLHQLRLAALTGVVAKVQTSEKATGIKDSTALPVINSLLEMRRALEDNPAISPAQIGGLMSDELERQLLRGPTNPLIGMLGVDIHQDTPTEILHTILLGVVKYYWAQTVFILGKEKRMELFQTRLASFDINGLNSATLSAEYIVQYKGSLIGKHFKSLAQIMPFLVYDLVPQIVLEAWNIIGELVVLLWHTEIANTEEYLAALSRTIEDFLNITARCAPSILITKPKFHFLIHLPLFIRRFGPAIICSTERYESFNHVFRLSSIYSNRQAPSRDSCVVFAEQDAVKHIATGGYWHDPIAKRWVQAGPAIHDYMLNHPEQMRLLGLPKTEKKCPGDATLAPMTAIVGHRPAPRDTVNWSTTKSSKIVQGQLETAKFFEAVSFIGLHGDKICRGSHVLFQRPEDDKPHVALVEEVLVPEDVPDKVKYIYLQRLKFGEQLHPSLKVPCLDLLDEHVVVGSKDVLCAANVHHDCASSGCTNVRHAPAHQERIQTTVQRSFISHNATPKFLLNTRSIHNYQYIAQAIPSSIKPDETRNESQIKQLRKLAAQQVRAMKKAKSKKDPEAGGSDLDLDIEEVYLSLPKFQQNAKAPKPKPKSTKLKDATGGRPELPLENIRMPSQQNLQPRQQPLPHPPQQNNLPPRHRQYSLEHDWRDMPPPVPLPYYPPLFSPHPGSGDIPRHRSIRLPSVAPQQQLDHPFYHTRPHQPTNDLVNEQQALAPTLHSGLNAYDPNPHQPTNYFITERQTPAPTLYPRTSQQPSFLPGNTTPHWQHTRPDSSHSGSHIPSPGAWPVPADNQRHHGAGIHLPAPSHHVAQQQYSTRTGQEASVLSNQGYYQGFNGIPGWPLHPDNSQSRS